MLIRRRDVLRMAAGKIYNFVAMRFEQLGDAQKRVLGPAARI